MHYKPHPYQTQAITHLLTHPQAVLMLEMGLGKTVITLTALNIHHQNNPNTKTLIIAPLRVAQDTWSNEIQKWDHLKHLNPSLILGTPHTRTQNLKTGNIHIINRENLPWLTQNIEWDYDTVIIDELSSFKTPSTQRFKALKKVRPHIKQIWGLTGTPASNSLLDLWAQYYLIDTGQRLGKAITTYRQNHFTPTKYVYGRPVNYQLLPGHDQHIYHQIQDITLSMRTKDHLQLPPITYTNHPCPLTQKAWKTYQQLKKTQITQIGDTEIDAASAAVLSNKLLQLANGAIYDENQQTLPVHEAKLDALEDIIEAANGKPLMVAYWFKHDLERIKQRFKQARTLDTSKDFKDWNEGKIQLGLIHPASAGHGLNLQQGGNLICWYSLTWSLELYQQLNARLYRQGQTQPVSVTHLIAKNTIDEHVIKTLETKNYTQTALIEAVKQQITGD